jgi:hypothetical protein
MDPQMRASDAPGSTVPASVLVALVDEDGDFDHVWDAAMAAAEDAPGARLVAYDSSSASALTEPVAAPVSAEGVGDQYGELLSPEELDTLGRRTIARRVEDARRQGVDAWGRLASHHGMEALMAFAEAQHANLVLLPEELDDPSLVDRVRGDTLEDASEASEVPIKVVSRRHGADGSRAD